MRPLICFYEDNSFIYSTSYTIAGCASDEPLSQFLNSIEKAHSSKMKIVQINFECGHEELFAGQKDLYQSPKASVFILNDYKIVNEVELLALLPEDDLKLEFNQHESKEHFIKKVNDIKMEIAAGRIYQVNLTSALEAKFTDNLDSTPEKLLKKFFNRFMGHYKALLPLNEIDVVSFSPELFLHKKNNELTTRPIKGSLAQDLSFKDELFENKKEEAELSMIVDLLRNDFNRIEAGHSAEVTQHRSAMNLGYIQHTYSEIKIQSASSLGRILDCTWPGGSISGCPKLESLRLISELESVKRQIYTGSIGWWKNQDFCLNLAIRTFIRSHDKIFYHAGCGIVYDSVAESEWDEFILKTGRINEPN